MPSGLPSGLRSGLPRALLPRRLAAVAPAALALIAGAGCYRHVPVAPSDLATAAPGATVRLFLTPTGTTQLAPRLGPETISLDGRVERASADSVALVVSRTTKAYGGTIAWVGERVTIPMPLVAHAERRMLDRGRTAGMALSGAAAAGAALAVLLGQHGAGSGSDPGNGGGGPSP